MFPTVTHVSKGVVSGENIAEHVPCSHSCVKTSCKQVKLLQNIFCAVTHVSKPVESNENIAEYIPYSHSYVKTSYKQ